MKKASETAPAPMIADCMASDKKPVTRESRVKPPTERRLRIMEEGLARAR